MVHGDQQRMSSSPIRIKPARISGPCSRSNELLASSAASTIQLRLCIGVPTQILFQQMERTLFYRSNPLHRFTIDQR